MTDLLFGRPPPPPGGRVCPKWKVTSVPKARKIFLALFPLFSHTFWSFFPELLLANPPGVWLLTYFFGRVTDLLFQEFLLPPRGGLKHRYGWAPCVHVCHLPRQRQVFCSPTSILYYTHTNDALQHSFLSFLPDVSNLMFICEFDRPHSSS